MKIKKKYSNFKDIDEEMCNKVPQVKMTKQVEDIKTEKDLEASEITAEADNVKTKIRISQVMIEVIEVLAIEMKSIKLKMI